MAKFATKTKLVAPATTGEKIATHEGGMGFVREPKAELYITAVSTTLDKTFYESANDRETPRTSIAGLSGRRPSPACPAASATRSPPIPSRPGSSGSVSRPACYPTPPARRLPP